MTVFTLMYNLRNGTMLACMMQNCLLRLFSFFFRIPINVCFWLLWGGVTDYKTDVLLVVTPDGQIYDQLLVGVMIVGNKGEYIPVVQYKITEDAKVIVYRLQPTASESIPLETFTSFTANRVDTTYEIGSDGKFKSGKTTKYKPRTYTREKLVDLNYNIWTGNELPMRSVENRN